MLNAAFKFLRIVIDRKARFWNNSTRLKEQNKELSEKTFVTFNNQTDCVLEVIKPSMSNSDKESRKYLLIGVIVTRDNKVNKIDNFQKCTNLDTDIFRLFDVQATIVTIFIGTL